MNDTSQHKGYACCFCGLPIDPDPPDVATLTYATCLGQAKHLQHEQEFYCHTVCLESKLHPQAKIYAAFLATNPSSETEDTADDE
ncbi:hypothetical protein SAMN05421770_105247 [Granulicella rosea]|uniref:Uncharacterized protein n=1 Tax=Granulicella rosea TaxID=474952 RepID=A0A239KX69_9BACT|nr:hypothetical protein SAMN05421770_105247 [Granulicella rosea]